MPIAMENQVLQVLLEVKNPGLPGKVANLTTFNEVIINPLTRYDVTVPEGRIYNSKMEITIKNYDT